MLKQLVLYSVLFIGQMPIFSQSTSNVHVDGPALFYIYLTEDTAHILQNWKLEKDETFAIQDLLQMQSDVFGRSDYPRTYRLSEKHSLNREKYSLATLEIDSIFSDDQSAQVSFSVFKGKKKKHQYKIQDIRIGTKTINTFIDSLCSPYLEMIKSDKVDSLAEEVYRIKELKESLEQFCENTSKKKGERAKVVYSFMLFSLETVQDGLHSIDKTVEPSFNECILTSAKKNPLLSVTYTFQGSNKERIKCTMDFSLKNDTYHLSGLGVSTGREFKEF